MKMPQIFPFCGAIESKIAFGSVTHPNFLLDGGFYTVDSFTTNGFLETREHTHNGYNNGRLYRAQGKHGGYYWAGGGSNNGKCYNQRRHGGKWNRRNNNW